jgi:uncharacterized membrane protein
MELGIQQVWQLGWQQKKFKTKLMAGAIVMCLLLTALPYFFSVIEQRNGYVLNDAVLSTITPVNMSVPIFAINWAMGLLMLYRCIKHPNIFIFFLWGFICLALSRVITISQVPLNPPVGMVELKDPVINAFYGSRFITKDLFFSGHTATQFLMFMAFTKRADKMLALAATVVMGILVLVQHVHYTIDVVAAPFLTFLVGMAARKIVGHHGTESFIPATEE